MKKILLFLSFLLMSIGVWGVTETLTESEIITNITNTSCVYGTQKTYIDGNVTWVASCYTDVANRKWMQLKKDANSYIKITTPNTTKISYVSLTITSAQNSKGGINDITKHTAYSGRIILSTTSAAVTATSTGVAYTETITSNQASLTPNGNNNELYIKTVAGSRIWGISVTYITSTTTHTVAYNTNGGSTITDLSSPYEEGASVTIKQGGTKNGYTFDSWNTKPDYSGTEFFGGETFTITKDTTFYAKWLKDTILYESVCNVFSETFSADTGSIGYRGGNDNIWNGEGTATGTLKFDNEGWESSHGKGANECGKFGTGDSIGYAKTPNIFYYGHNNMLLSFRCGAWQNASENGTIYLIGNGVKIDGQDTITVSIAKSTWNTYMYSLSPCGNFRLTWKSANETEGSGKNKNRFFLDDICITEASNQLDIISWYNDSIIISKDYFDSIPFDADNIRIDGLLTKTLLTENMNGEYKVPVNLSESYCLNKKFIVSDGVYALSQTIKIPRIITSPTNTSTISNADCDVVVQSTLTVSGTTSANRDVKLYGGAHLSVPLGTTYTVNSLSLRKDNLTPSTLGLTGTLNASKLYFDLYIDYTDWYWTCLPAEYNMSNLKYVNGITPTYESDYWVRLYDGEHRAATQSGSWKGAPVDITFQQGTGFLFGLSDNLKKKEFRFELPTSTLAAETENKTLENLHAWGGNTNVRPNHKGWNMIGNPFLNSVITDLASPIKKDSLVKVLDGSGNWTGQWELSNTTRGKTLRYAVIPSDDPEDADAGWYKSVVLDDITLYPFTCFFVQIGGENPLTNQTITFNAADRGPLMASRRALMYDEDEELFLRIKVDNRKIGCFISNKFIDEYEPGDDLESRYPIYQSIGGYKLLYSAIPDSTLIKGVTVHSPAGHLILDPKVDITKFEEIYVLYNNNWYDLLHGEELDIETGNFIIYAKRKQKDISTDIENISTSNYIKYFDKTTNQVVIKYKNYVVTPEGKMIKAL